MVLLFATRPMRCQEGRSRGNDTDRRDEALGTRVLDSGGKVRTKSQRGMEQAEDFRRHATCPRVAYTTSHAIGMFARQDSRSAEGTGGGIHMKRGLQRE